MVHSSCVDDEAVVSVPPMDYKCEPIFEAALFSLCPQSADRISQYFPIFKGAQYISFTIRLRNDSDKVLGEKKTP
jgi:hypothetical protein